MKKSQFKMKGLALIVSTVVATGFSVVARAETNDSLAAKEKSTQLDTIHVKKSKFRVHRTNVSNLGTFNKTAETLSREQVENIRDLPRTNPGIGVNEGGGRGTTRGFSMNGVERERVGLTYDGLGSIPAFRREDRVGAHGQSRSSAAINEIEYENLKAIQLQKGADSVNAGSGSLGGAVMAQTKDTEDWFDADSDNQWAGRVKAGYTSRDLRTVLSGGIAYRSNLFEGFLQHTYRKGHEIRAHGDLYKGGATIHLRNGSTSAHDHYFAAEDVSGEDRRVPNPLDYDSNSTLSKAGINLNENHYVGAILDFSKQNFMIREMFLPNFDGADGSKNKGLDIISSVIPGSYENTPSQFYIDNHKNNRYGLEYKYRPQEKSFLDNANVILDHRELEIKSEVRTLRCAKFPSVDPNCWPGQGQTGTYGRIRQASLKEKDYRLALDAAKNANWGSVRHSLYGTAGLMHSRYTVTDFSRIQKEDKGFVPESVNNVMSGMKGRTAFIGLADSIRYKKLQVNAGVRYDTLTYTDPHPTQAQILTGFSFRGAHHDAFSWNLGASYQVTDFLKLKARAASGFRFPSIIEQIGPVFNLKTFEAANAERDAQGPLQKETSLNQQIGVEFIHPVLNVDLTYSRTDYRNVIDIADKFVLDPSGAKTSKYAYFNVHNFSTHGFDIKARLDGNALWDKIPAGLDLFVNASVTKILHKPHYNDKDYAIVGTYAFDSIQPLRVVSGISYTDPDDRWGLTLTNTWSKGKNPEELVVESKQGGYKIRTSRFSKVRSKAWATADLTGFYKYGKHLTIRGGIYNIFNYRYITWENLRQTGYGLDARITTNNYVALAAPGRNFYVNLEYKF